jgi:hypothetical protein
MYDFDVQLCDVDRDGTRPSPTAHGLPSKASPRLVVGARKDPARLERRMAFDLAVTDRHLFVTLGAATFDGVLTSYGLS